MGLFSRPRPKPVPVPLTAPTTSIVYQSPPVASPPPYYEPSPFVNPAQYAYNAPWAQAPAPTDGFLNVDDFNAIQQVLDQDSVSEQFINIISNIDEHGLDENDDNYSIIIPHEAQAAEAGATRAILPHSNSQVRDRSSQPSKQKVTIWSKVSLYANSKLPPDLPPLRVYIPTWPLICLAAQYSADAYKAPTSSREREAFVSADARLGTKAMVMKSVPYDDKKTLVFAIRGTSKFSLRDWNVNLRTEPASPVGFLDDEGNLCHEGFLQVARAMIKPIAMRLRSLLEENPNRTSCSLLITGHSAGGAVAALLFSHMLSTQESELSILTGCFKRVHCVTFGAPPVSLLPLTKPRDKRFQKSLFFSFMNEGDPVVRADKPYLRSLVDLLSTPVTIKSSSAQRDVAAKHSLARLQQSMSRLDLTLSRMDLSSTNNQNAGYSKPLTSKHSRFHLLQSKPNTGRPAHRHMRYWPVPEATLSNAGRLVIIRLPERPLHHVRKGSTTQATASLWEKENLNKVTAHTVTDDLLRQVVFGNPAMHAMVVYSQRIEMLALKAVTARA